MLYCMFYKLKYHTKIDKIYFYYKININAFTVDYD